MDGSTAEAATSASPLASDRASSRPRDLPATGLRSSDLVELLESSDPADLHELDLLGAVAGWQQVIGQALAAQAGVVAELMARRPATSSYPVDDLCALATTSYGAGALIARGDGLRAHPLLADALRTGLLDQRKVDVLLDEVARLPRDAADGVLRAALDDADGMTAPFLRRRVRRLVAAVDPEAATKRAEKARSDRCVRLDWAGDAMAWVSALLPAADAVAAFSVVDTLADAAQSDGDDRTLAQRRADAFGDVFGAILADGRTPAGQRLPSRQGDAPGIHLTLAASTWVGDDDMPGELAGYGAIPAPIARELAAAATRLRRAVIDEEGHLLALGPHLTRTPDPATGYRPGAPLRRFVVARDESCVFPGCRRAAEKCDLDHIEPYDHDRSPVEQTIASNLPPLCRHHHRSTTHHGWRMRRDSQTGDVHTTTPDGITYVRPATTILLTRSAYEHALAGPPDRAEPPPEPPPPF
ncbi:HNH endonuclease signature motif containing protein [Cellulomonas alba]|uniref:DUF222 domain-containing protein n=1 Tax=Cellulomonas alba TaxID=3053467 RepID=A0ABT7SBQ3_9CELL|nr:HNH endonuclease signature motif containing protein [Cellulomonas alba]MDM7853504.1 DUF222 domain-containing protein [Cellulomonas alba]